MGQEAKYSAVLSKEVDSKDDIRISLEEGVLTITLDDPATRNAIDARVARRLGEILRLASVDADVGAIIVTGAGGGFCSGGNFKAFGGRDPGDPLDTCADQERWRELEAKALRYEFGAETTRLLHEMAKPTIALVTGPAVGAGVGLAAACDFRVISPVASFRPGYLRVGISPDFGTSYFVTQILGSAKAREYFLLKDVMSAEEAIANGFATYLGTDDGDAEQYARAIAGRLAEGPPIAIEYTKAAINQAETRSLGDVLAFEARNFARCFQSQDTREAVTAFMEKRKPEFKGK